MTFDYCIKDSYSYEKIEKTSFECPFTKDVYDSLVHSFPQVYGKKFTNGKCVRLDKCAEIEGKSVLTISSIQFFDFLLTNFLYLNYHKVISVVTGEVKAQIEHFYQSVTRDIGSFSFERIIAKKQLSNLFAISCIISDGERYLITKRNGSVGISNNFYSTTATGIIDDEDFMTEDPVLSCCQREIAEEIGYGIPITDMKFRHIVCGDDKIQPIALIDAKVDNILRVVDCIKSNNSFLAESSDYALYSKDDIRQLLANNNALLTSAGRTHLEIAIR